MNRRRIAANPYLPAETNPFGQQENPSVPTNENIEQGIAPTEPEGPRVVTGPDTPETAKPRGEVVTVDASLDRMKVAVVCEGCGQRGLLRLGQVSDSTRCRCGSARVELLEASRRIAEKECTCWEGYERVPGTEPCASGSCRKKTSLRTASNKVYKVGMGADATATANAPVGTKGRKITLVFADGREVTFTDSRSRFLAVVYAPYLGEDILTNGSATASGASKGEGARGVSSGVWSNLRVVEIVDPPVAAAAFGSRRRTSMRWRKSVSNGYGHWTSETLSAPDGQGSVYAVVYKDMQSRRPYAWGVVGIPNQEVDGKAETLAEAKSAAVAAMKGFTVSSSRRTASGWMQSQNPHHHYKPVVKNGYELNLFASDVDYRWAVDAMVTGDSSSLELFEQGIGTSLEDAKSQAEQSAQFFQG